MAGKSAQRAVGTVYLVGAGPGDPELVTLRGLHLISSADVILYDNLAASVMWAHARPESKKIYVGKKRAEHVHSQQQINQMLIEQARAGHRVVRLKGGDPYIFGRGGEEAEALSEAGVPFEVVPGVSSALGVAAYAGVPLTHRGLTSAVVFVTGHESEGMDWAKVGTEGTLVIFMGLTTFGEIAQRLIDAGRPRSTPALAVRWGTRGDQVSVAGTLEDLSEKICRHNLKPPALVIVGEVVSLRPKLNWYENLPLFGRTVIVTRAREQAAPLSEALRRLGANIIEFPTIEIRPPGDWGPLDRALAALGDYDWLLFTSANGVRFFTERLDQSGADWRDLRARICAIGPATADSLRALHLKVDLMPEEYVAESVLAAFAKHDLAGQRILLPRAAVARDLIPVELEKRGAQVDVVAAYQTVAPRHSPQHTSALFQSECKPDWITFTSSSTVKNFARLCRLEDFQGVRIASIGPITSKTVLELGLHIDAEAKEYTIEGLVEALALAEQQKRG